MHRTFLSLLPAFLLCTTAFAADTGPFDPENWPSTRDPKKHVHYITTDGDFTPPGDTWLAAELQILTGGDQVTTPITIGGHAGRKATGNYLNIADQSFTEWADDDVIDILMQVYGDAAVLNAASQPRNFNFLTGTLPELVAPRGGTIPVEGKNQKWNWVLFRITNGTRASNGSHHVGSIPPNAQGATTFGGVNGGTIRMESVPGLIVRVIAFGEQGAFGEPEQINVFTGAEQCEPEPETNLASIDFQARTTNHLEVLNTGDQKVVIVDNAGPAGNLRRAVRAEGTFMNFGIVSNYFGKPCNDPRTIKICVEFYDDPALVGAIFGPEAYATDAVGGQGTYPVERRHTLEGTGQWVRRSFTVPNVNLKGVNTGTLTGGPRLVFEGGNVLISSLDMAILRVETNSLAGLDPLAGCAEDPKVCTGAYGNFVELDLAKGVENGLTPGTSAGDQNMVQEETGPAGDRRLAIRPAFDDGAPGAAHNYMNFSITEEALGPTSQPNANLAIAVTYYDDPDRIGATFRPEVYQSDRNGIVGLAFTPNTIAVALEGTGKWRDAYFEIPDMKFAGVNQGPQAAARFVFGPNQPPYGKVFFSRVRYAVIRSCGPQAGVNLLADVKLGSTPPVLKARLNPDRALRLSWPAAAAGFHLEESPALAPGQWSTVTAAPTVEGSDNVVTLTPAGTRFYRLAQ